MSNRCCLYRIEALCSLLVCRVRGALGLLLLVFASHSFSHDRPLIFSYWNQASPPFVIVEKGTLKSGIIKDIGDLLGKEFGRPTTYVKLPTKRIEPFIISNRLDFDCITSPIWKETPKAYQWSPILFKGADRFLVRPGADNEINQFSDLRGRILGIYHDYTYHPEIMRMIRAKEVVTAHVHNLEKATELLIKKRIDVFIDFGIVIRYFLRENGLGTSLAIAKMPADTFDLHCTYRNTLDIDQQRVDQTFKKLVNDGAFSNILKRYQ